MSNGEPFQLNTATDLFYTDNDYNKPIRDPRLYETMLVNGTQFGDHAAELWIGGRDNINDTEKETGKYATGFGCYKFYKEGVNSLKDKYLMAISASGRNVSDLCGRPCLNRRMICRKCY